MARPSLEQARSWFEERFEEVHSYSSGTHPPDFAPRQCPTGALYFIVFNGTMKEEGYPSPSTETPVEDWFKCVTMLWELKGRPRFLWWRTQPQMEEGSIYSRLAMTHSGPTQSYTGNPIKCSSPKVREVA